ncbi:MAG: DUF3520 domain-containing protein [Deltaproteobacteria bacterium]|nr:DUF3520 domain-containing protein [Deltaproteobacteria bacterium]
MKRMLIKIGLVCVMCGVLPLSSCEAGDDNSTGMMASGDADTDGDADFDGDWGAEAEKDDANEGDSYEKVGTNPFVMADHDPFSTFAADVDTASYDIFRRDINYGTLPQPAGVRLEEYVNYFTYDYPAPSTNDAHPFSISMDAAPNLLDNGTTLLRVGIQGELPPGFVKKAANVVFLIDTSGSMSSSEKLPLVRHTLTSALHVLEEGDKLSIVTYAGNTSVRLSPTDVSNRKTIEDAINSLGSGGSTAGAAGIDLAYNQAEAGFIEGGINHVVLCTDGDFNVGPSSDQERVALIEEKRKTGITLTVLGFGIGNLNDSMMEKLSNAGNGNYAVISSKSQANDYVEKRMLSNMVLIAKDMKIQVEFNPNHVLAYRLLGYENRAIADDDFRDDKVDGGEVGAGHRVTALYELVLTGQSVPEVDGAPEITSGDPVEGIRDVGPADMVLVKVRYKDVDATEADSAYEVSSTIIEDQVMTSLSGADSDFRWAAAVAAFAEILKESPYADLDAIDGIATIVKEKNWLDEDRVEFVDLFDQARSMLVE